MRLPGVKVEFMAGLLNLCKQAIPAPPRCLGETMSHSPHVLARAATSVNTAMLLNSRVIDGLW